MFKPREGGVETMSNMKYWHFLNRKKTEIFLDFLAERGGSHPIQKDFLRKNSGNPKFHYQKKFGHPK